MKSTPERSISKLVTTCSQPWPNSKPRNWMDSNTHQPHPWKSQPTSKPITSLIQLTGEPREQSTQLKIKLNADHAGHSQLLLPLKELTSFKLELFFPSPNNNSLIATLLHTDAKEDGNQTPSSTLNLNQKTLKVPTSTLLWPKLARNQNTKDKFK